MAGLKSYLQRLNVVLCMHRYLPMFWLNRYWWIFIISCASISGIWRLFFQTLLFTISKRRNNIANLRGSIRSDKSGRTFLWRYLRNIRHVLLREFGKLKLESFIYLSIKHETWNSESVVRWHFNKYCLLFHICYWSAMSMP